MIYSKYSKFLMPLPTNQNQLCLKSNN